MHIVEIYVRIGKVIYTYPCGGPTMHYTEWLTIALTPKTVHEYFEKNFFSILIKKYIQNLLTKYIYLFIIEL